MSGFASLDAKLAGQLFDPSGTYYNAGLRAEALRAALMEYSRYFPQHTRYGVGTLAKDALGSDTEITVIGDFWKNGDTIRIGAYSETEETRTVSGVQVVEGDDTEVLPRVSLGLTQALTYTHEAGEVVAKDPLGLVLTSGVDTYLLPKDWLYPDINTFDLAIGVKSQVRRTVSYYDALYRVTSRLSQWGFGRAQNVGLIPIYGTYPLMGNPFSNVNEGMTDSQQVVFRFVSGAQPMLYISLPPAITKSVDIWYYRMQDFPTLPLEAVEPVLHYAKYAVYTAQASRVSQGLDFQEADVAEFPSRSAQALTQMAAAEKAHFEQFTRHRPIMQAG